MIMIGLLFLGVIALWLAWGVLFGQWVYRKKESRWLQLAATLFALWLPLWDAIPGYLLYQKVVREIGGVRIYQTVSADGYLDHMLGNDCWQFLANSPYAYCESAGGDRDEGSLGPLNAKVGYYEYRLAPIDAPECAPFREQLNVEATQQTYQLGLRCVVATRRDEPLSRYEYDMGPGEVPSPWPLPPVLTGWQRVRDRVTGETVAQATTVAYTPWILRSFKRWGAVWNYSEDASGRPIVVDQRELIRPANSDRK